MGAHELRKFMINKNMNKQEANKIFTHAFQDIYIYKKGLTQVGIKVRKPKSKDFGWKISAIQVKQRTDNNGKHSLYQQWKKQVFEFDAKIKLQNIQKFNDKLCEFLSKSVKIRNEELLLWLKSDITELFSITKSKVKTFHGEKGQILLKPILKTLKVSQQIYLTTESVQGSKQNVHQQIQNNNFKSNLSYPDLLQVVSNGKLQILS